MSHKSILSVKSKLYRFQTDLIQIKILVKHFLLRSFKNNSLHTEDQKVSLMSLGFALLFVVGTAWGALMGTIGEKFQFITIMMTLTGIFSVLYWDSFFFDSKDHINLVVLPVKSSLILISKFSSVLLIICFITMTFSITSTFFFTQSLAKGGTLLKIHYWATLVLTNFLANFSIFLIITAMQGILMLFIRGRGLSRILPFVQGFLLIGLVSVFQWFPRVYKSLPGMEKKLSQWHYFFPPIWFNGFHHYLLDPDLPLYGIHFKFALLLGIVLPSAAYLICLPLSLKGFLNRSSGKKLRAAIFSRRLLHRAKLKFNSLFLRDSVERAVFYFFILIFKRNKSLKMRLAMYLALPIGVFLTHLGFVYFDKGLSYMSRVSVPLISFPVLLYFSLIAGLRILAEHPVNLRANWLFKLSTESHIESFLKGAKKAMFFYTILPLTLILAFFYFTIWEFSSALIHIVFCILIALIWQEVLFFSFNKIPFTTEYNLQILDMKSSWWLLLTAYLFYYHVIPTLGTWLQEFPIINLAYYLTVGAILFWLKWQKKRNGQYLELKLIFEEEPDPAMLSLNLK